MNILEILKSKEIVSGNAIGEVLGISRAAVHKQINALKQIGYKIKSSSKGYVLINGKNLFNEYEIESKLKEPLKICKTVKYYKQLPSTQTTVKKLAQKNFKEGFIIVAEKQTNSYGRIKRTWSSNSGGLWFSILLKPSISPDEASKLTLILSIALKRTLKEYKVDSEIKWSNDVFVNGKKIAGILVEMSAEQDGINWIVAGIGININNKLPKKFAGISLKEILKREVDRAEFLAKFLAKFEEIYNNFCNTGFEMFVEEYNRNIAYKNEIVTIDDGCNNVVSGVNLGIDKDGRLMVNTKVGLEKIVSGTLRKEVGYDSALGRR
ncbi:MAG: biotin--[acetyl-CoA-carboxylase] ligase [Endomicrobium sp.]|jgi:BirA family biotin operon repressor/biotin-[acetyl-CoA-carboxylase] ligase|nr:biotin--[acetyl-CoA-carboxylase] ligase [Endomicrobium sp.]